ncbi:hypothetical protein ACET3Z_014357 [Daucus carota]
MNEKFARRALSNNKEKKLHKVTVTDLKTLGKNDVEAFFMLHVKIKSIDESMGGFTMLALAVRRRLKWKIHVQFVRAAIAMFLTQTGSLKFIWLLRILLIKCKWS